MTGKTWYREMKTHAATKDRGKMQGFVNVKSRFLCNSVNSFPAKLLVLLYRTQNATTRKGEMPTVAGRLQEKNGLFYIVLSYKDSAGKRRQPWIATGLPVKGNKKRAEQMLAETRKNFTIPKGQASELSPDMAFSDYMRYWLKMMRTAVTETTYSSYCFNVEKHIIPYFEPLGVTLAGLQPRQIQSFYLHEWET